MQQTNDFEEWFKEYKEKIELMPMEILDYSGYKQAFLAGQASKGKDRLTQFNEETGLYLKGYEAGQVNGQQAQLQKDIEKLEGSVEAFADLEHDRWSSWEKYRQSITDTDVHLSPEEFKRRYSDKVDGWKRKRETPYSKLTNAEQESDRVEAWKTINLAIQTLKEE